MSALFFRCGRRHRLHRKTAAHPSFFCPNAFGIGNQYIFGHIQKARPCLGDGRVIGKSRRRCRRQIVRFFPFFHIVRQYKNGVDVLPLTCFPVRQTQKMGTLHRGRHFPCRPHQIFFGSIIDKGVNDTIAAEQANACAVIQSAQRRFYLPVHHGNMVALGLFHIKFRKVRPCFQSRFQCMFHHRFFQHVPSLPFGSVSSR